MTLEQAIQHCKEVAIEYEAKGECYECGNEHRQLAEWLEDYKELKQMHTETVDGMEVLERRYEDAMALLEIALHDIERLVNCNSPTECIDLARLRSVSFMGGVIELPNVWRYADEAKELIENGKVNERYNYCMICGEHISPYKQVCRACETKYGIRIGDSIMGKMQEYIKKLEKGDTDEV